MTTRRDILTGLSGLALGSLTGTAHARSGALMPRGTQSILAEHAPIGRFGYILVDVDSGEVVDEQGADELLIPASLSKIPTSIAAMTTLGPGGQFATRLKADGQIADGVLNGDLYLIGGGDPTLETADLVELATKMQAAGVQAITGRFIYYTGGLPNAHWLDRTQPWQAPYNPSMGGLNLNYNRVRFQWASDNGYLRVRGAAVSDGRVLPAPSVQFRVTQDGPEMLHQATTGVETWSLRQSLLTGKGQRWLPVRKPGAFTAGVFREVCAERGIILPDAEFAKQAPKGTEIARHVSDTVYEMLHGMLKYSNNLTAEALGVAAAYADDKNPRSIREAAAMTARLMVKEVRGIGGRGWNGFAMENHSGLSVLSRATPRQMAYMLRAGQQKWGERYLALFTNKSMTPERMGLPPGTLPPKHYILGKTGSMNFVRGLAGYIRVNDRPMTYAFMANEDSSREILNNQFTPYGDVTPPEARNWSRRAKEFERAMMAEWLLRYST